MTSRFADNPDYRRYEQLLIGLHSLIACGRGDSAEADNVREEMEGPWHRLAPSEQVRLRGLSGDLYMLHGEEALDPAISAALTNEGLLSQIHEAQSWNDWESVLGLLRRRPASAPPDAAALSRCRAYEALGHHDAALLFLDFAYRSNRSDPHYRGLRMMIESEAQLDEAARSAEAVLVSADSPPFLSVIASDILLRAAERLSGNERHAAILRILERLRPVLEQKVSKSALPTQFLVIGQLVRGASLSALGRPEEAISALDSAIEADPGDRLLRSIRKVLVAQQTPEAQTTALTHALEHRRDLAKREFSPRLAA